jgi:DNA-binding beta-propeller fold protein YncE
MFDPKGRNVAIVDFRWGLNEITSTTPGPFVYATGTGNNAVSTTSSERTFPDGSWALITTHPVRLAGAISLTNNPSLATSGSNIASTNGWFNLPWSFGSIAPTLTTESIYSSTPGQGFRAAPVVNLLGYGNGIGMFTWSEADGGGTQYGAVIPFPVPEPSTYAMALAGLACGGYAIRWRRRRRCPHLLHALAAVTLLAGEIHADTLYVTNFYSGNVGKYYTDGTTLDPNFIAGLTYPLGIATDAAGNVLVTERPFLNDTINKYQPNGVVVSSPFIGGLQTAAGIAQDRFGNLYVARYGGYQRRVSKFAADGSELAADLIGNLSYPFSIAIDAEDNLYVVNVNSRTVGKYRTDGTVVSTTLISTPDFTPEGIAVEPATGNLFICGSGNVQVFTADGALLNGSLVTGVSPNAAIGFDSWGNLYLGNFASGGNGSIGAYKPDGSVINSRLITGLDGPYFLTLHPGEGGPPQPAVPEPSTYAMALAGIACGGFSMWRRRKRHRLAV